MNVTMRGSAGCWFKWAAMAETSPEKLNDRQMAFVAAYLNEARFNATKAAEIAGYKNARQNGTRLLSNIVIKAEIDRWRAEMKQSVIADSVYRVARMRELELKYFALIDARAVDLKDEAAGGETGLLVRQTKQIGGGPTAEKVVEYAADTAVTREIRELYKQVAQELGQWISRSDNTTKISVEADELAQRVAEELGLDKGEVLAEAQAIIAGGR